MKEFRIQELSDEEVNAVINRLYEQQEDQKATIRNLKEKRKSLISAKKKLGRFLIAANAIIVGTIVAFSVSAKRKNDDLARSQEMLYRTNAEMLANNTRNGYLSIGDFSYETTLCAGETFTKGEYLYDSISERNNDLDTNNNIDKVLYDGQLFTKTGEPFAEIVYANETEDGITFFIRNGKTFGEVDKEFRGDGEHGDYYIANAYTVDPKSLEDLKDYDFTCNQYVHYGVPALSNEEKLYYTYIENVPAERR